MTGKVAKLKYMQVLMVFGVFFVKLHCMLLKNFDEIKSNGCKKMVSCGIFQNSWRTSIHQISDWKKDNLLIIWSNMNPDIKLFKYLFSINLYFSRLLDKTPAMKKLNNLLCGYTQLKSLFVTEFMFLVKFVNSICYSLIAMVLDP